MGARLARETDGRIVAVLGPTNTGKTHLAVERMLGHRTGLIALPLRLLAREVYDRIVARRGPRDVALVTGEEKIVPPDAAYVVCTVEAMPAGHGCDFLAIDEIQLCGDPERGHVFTDRLLHARGRQETLFLGAETMRPVIRRLLPEAEFMGRSRFSELTYAGERKVSRLPRRSAIVAFSAAEVYALAELVRRQRGGAAVVLGALSPRTRNAQVEMYQSGEVDYMVATDAIGMGLNMHVDHVAFAARRKFDGIGHRELGAAEIGQIAGRAGRHMRSGTFGVTAGQDGFETDLVERVQGHRFDPVTRILWRNADLDFRSPTALASSLRVRPPDEVLTRGRDADDVLALAALSEDRDIAGMAAGRGAVRLLWEVCQIPDFRKTAPNAHHMMLKRIFRHLMAAEGVLPTDWVARELERIDRIEGDIDTLSQRIAHVRTWTYVSHRGHWLDDARGWQERARAIEDRLSDALHAALMQRFVDRRTSVLLGGLKAKQDLQAAIGHDGEVLVEGHFVGRLRGLDFTPAETDPGSDRRAVMNAANRVLAGEMARRVAALVAAEDGEFDWRDDNLLWWRGAPVARLLPGADPLRPQVDLLPVEHVGGPPRERARRRLADWLERRLADGLQPLARLAAADLAGPARGVAFQLLEAYGNLPRAALEPLIATLQPADRRRLQQLGVRLGYVDVFVPAMLRPARAGVALALWSVGERLGALPATPAAGLVSVPAAEGVPDAAYAAAGFRRLGQRAVRLDMLDRLAGLAHAESQKGPFRPDHAMLSLLGTPREDLDDVLRALGYRPEGEGEDVAYRFVGRRRRRPAAEDTARPRAPSQSPFAGLARHRLAVQEV